MATWEINQSHMAGDKTELGKIKAYREHTHTAMHRYHQVIRDAEDSFIIWLREQEHEDYHRFSNALESGDYRALAI
jgi:hypothetical protein